jgi:hypothetical protein
MSTRLRKLKDEVSNQQKSEVIELSLDKFKISNELKAKFEN